MEPHSVAPSKGRMSWQRALLTVSLVIFWNLPITAQLTIEAVPANVVEGKDVLLLAHGPSASDISYSWYRGERLDSMDQIGAYLVPSQTNTPGPAYSGRETIYPNGSLLFQNVTLNYTGTYTLQMMVATGLNEKSSAQFHVYKELPIPFIIIISNNSNPVENKDLVTLKCEPETQDTTYLWLRNNQSLPDSTRVELSTDNRTLTINKVTRNESGLYECKTWNPVSARRSDPFTLNVLYGPDTPTISPSDLYYTLGETLNLTCYAASNPRAQYSWLINGSNQQSTQQLVISKVTINDSGSYSCHVYNNATGLNRTTVTNITVFEQLTMPTIKANNSTVAENTGPVVLKCDTKHKEISISWFHNGQILQLGDKKELSPDNSTLTINRVERNDNGEYECEVSNPSNSIKSEPFTLIVTYEESSGLSAGAIAGIVIGVLVGVALIAALVYFLINRKSRGASDQYDHTEHKPSAFNHSQDDTSPNTVNEVAYSSLNFNAQQPKSPTSSSPAPTATETIYCQVKQK